MPSVAFDQFLPEIMVEAPGVPTPVAVNAVRNACYDLCWESLVWNATLDPEVYVSGTAEYALTPPPGAQIISLLTVTRDDAAVLSPTTLEAISTQYPDWAVRTGTPEWYTQPNTSTLTLFPTPDSDGEFRVLAAFAPTRSASGVESFIYDQHLETVKYGALWKLKSMFGQPWSDASGAVYMEQRFWQGVLAATVQRNKGNSRAMLRVSARPFV